MTIGYLVTVCHGVEDKYVYLFVFEDYHQLFRRHVQWREERLTREVALQSVLASMENEHINTVE